jgi:ArsR family transcriptional regulator
MAVKATIEAPTVTSGPACCPTGLATPLDRESATDLARLMKAVADPARLQIVSLLRAAPDCASCVCDITDATGLSQPTVSHHLKVLFDAGIVDREKRGYWTWYSLLPTRLSELGAVFA